LYYFTNVNGSLYLRTEAWLRYMFKDPVCNMMVDERTAKFVAEAQGGKKVYLCSAACKQQFNANPRKYGY
jgi:YHS domain-containing protein